MLVVLGVLTVILTLLLLRPGAHNLSVTESDVTANADRGRSGLAPGVISAVPLTVAASSTGDHPALCWWLSVNSAGQAQLSDGLEEAVTFQIPQEDWEAFRKALERERFFDMDAQYGEHVPDGSSVTLTVTAGFVTHTISLRYTNNLSPADREEANRVARLCRMLQDWVYVASQPGEFRQTLTYLVVARNYRDAVAYLSTVHPTAQLSTDIEQGHDGVMGVYGITLHFPGTDDSPRLRDVPWWAMPGTSDAIENEEHAAWIGAASAFATEYNTELRKRRPELFQPTSQPSGSP